MKESKVLLLSLLLLFMQQTETLLVLVVQLIPSAVPDTNCCTISLGTNMPRYVFKILLCCEKMHKAGSENLMYNKRQTSAVTDFDIFWHGYRKSKL